MKDDLPRFPTPMEAFGQGKRKHTSAAFDAVGEVPKPPPQQRYRQKVSSGSGSSTPVNTPPVNPYYASQVGPAQSVPARSAPATPNHPYHGMHHTMGLNGHAVPQPVLRNTHPYEKGAPTPPIIPQQIPQQVPQQPLQPLPQQVPQQPLQYPQQQMSYVPRVATAPPVHGANAPAHPGAYYHPSGTIAPSNPNIAQTQYVPQGPSPPPSRAEASKGSRRPAPEPSRPQPNDTADLRSLFDEVDRKKHGYLTERELSKALVNGDYTLFDAHTVRLMMRMFDRDGDGAIYFAEFGQLWKYLHEWRQVFDRFDTSGNDSIDPDEFKRALAAFGYSLSAPCIQFMFNAGSKLNRQGVRVMPFDLFVQTCISIKSITDTFKRYDTDRDGFVTMSFEDFLTETTKLH